jgi:hypothetical protein
LLSNEHRLLVFSHVSYHKVIRNVDFARSDTELIRIVLVPETLRVQEVVVTGKRVFVPSKGDEKRALHSIDGDEFEKLGEAEMEKAMGYLLPDIVKPLLQRMTVNSEDFTLYVDGVWKESLYLDDIDPFQIRRVWVWGTLGKFGLVDPFPIGLPIRRGSKYVILVETK